MNIKLLTEHHLECLSLTGGCTGSPESTLVKMPHCWKSHVMAHMFVSIEDSREAIKEITCHNHVSRLQISWCFYLCFCLAQACSTFSEEITSHFYVPWILMICDYFLFCQSKEMLCGTRKNHLIDTVPLSTTQKFCLRINKSN